ncbi:MAG: reverse transcriptase [Pseudomonas sp. PGPPP1]|uniref:reverse transcriptase family protein n=1 Tax=Pseudomonas sp. PGPPP1 TaxID=2015553 RepID=UPI000BDBFC36|nr:reverse transcriptase family protein [Pseudomonas sp. PGPPP1]OYU05564.1 MAG: reverse transcriptase [Pseudomonas sp. PGPPP1]
MAAVNPKKVTSESIANIDRLCAALDITAEELCQVQNLHEDAKYQASTVEKSDGSFRKIYNPDFRLRKIQRRINKRIFSNSKVIAWPDHLYGSVPNQINDDFDLINKDYVSCAAKHCGAKSILKLDIKDFFDNIHKIIVHDIFLNFLKYPQDVSSALASICCLNDHVVQGALTSSYLASLSLYDVEGYVVEKLHRKNLVYTRLVDDITVSSKTSNYDFSYAINLIEGMLTEKELPLNKKKTKVQYTSSEPLTVHGLRVAFKQPRLPSDEVARIRTAVKNIETLAKEVGYRTTLSYRQDFNRCMGRVNKLSRVNHEKHLGLVKRLVKVYPLPSKKDISRAEAIVARLEKDYASKHSTYWYSKRFHTAHERLNILKRSFPCAEKALRKRLKSLRPIYD